MWWPQLDLIHASSVPCAATGSPAYGALLGENGTDSGIEFASRVLTSPDGVGQGYFRFSPLPALVLLHALVRCDPLRNQSPIAWSFFVLFCCIVNLHIILTQVPTTKQSKTDVIRMVNGGAR